MSDELSRLKWLAMIADVSSRPATRRLAMHLYLESLYSVAMKAYPALRPFGNPVGSRTSKPLGEIQEALLQASNGEVPRLFEDIFRTKRPGRPPTRRGELLCWATAAAVITILMNECGKTEDEAARLVEKHLRDRGFHLPTINRPDTAPAWRRLQSWRDKCIAGDKGSLAKRFYRDALRFMGDPVR